ncbi:MAG: hypothetical protein JSV22_09750 [Bacteroidales bacterium]|nr:MAG: hypothetical protein JSV22_09750 [Bacteroidales bacterium]
MKNILYIILLVVYSVRTFAQEAASEGSKSDSAKEYKYCFRYSVDENSLYNIEDEELKSHPFGDYIARKFHMLKKSYTYVERATPTSPGEKIIVVKPSIYYALQKLNKYFKKQVKDGMMTEEEARQELNQYLDIAISIVVENTESLENDLRKAKKPDEISRVFSMVMLE